MNGPNSDAMPSESLSHRRYVDYSHVHYAGNLVNGAYAMGAFGDIATDLSVREDGDEGLLAGYSSVTFHAPIRAGDVVDVRAHIVRRGIRSRTVEFTAWVISRVVDSGSSGAEVLPEPLLAVSAVGTVVVPAAPADDD